MRLFCERKLIFHCLLLNRNGKYGVLNVVKHSKHSSSWTIIYDIFFEFFWYKINDVIIEYVRRLTRKMNIRYILLCNDKNSDYNIGLRNLYSHLLQEHLWFWCGHVKCLLRWVFYGRWSVIDYTKQQVLASNLKRRRLYTLNIVSMLKIVFYWAFARSWPQYSYKTELVSKL